MKAAVETSNKQNQSRAVANNVSKQKNYNKGDSEFVDNRPETKALKSLQMMINNSPRMVAQRQRVAHIIGGTDHAVKGPDKNVKKNNSKGPLGFRDNGPGLAAGRRMNVSTGSAGSTKFTQSHAPFPFSPQHVSPKTIQLKPIETTTEYLNSAPPEEPVFGMNVLNKITGDNEGLKGYKIAENIQESERDDIFKVKKSLTSEGDYKEAGEDEVRLDMHAIGEEVIDKQRLTFSKPGDHFKYTVKQNFLYKRTEDKNGDPLPVQKSGFIILHSIGYNYVENAWVHSVSKIPKDVIVNREAAKAGSGYAYSNIKVINKKKSLTGVSEMIKKLKTGDLKPKDIIINQDLIKKLEGKE